MEFVRNLASAFVITIAFIIPSAQSDDFGIEFEWYDGMKPCFSKKSPEIKLFNVPEGTTKFKVKMIDKDAPGFGHGGGKMKYDGGDSIPQGALKNWKGPCPPSRHKYVFQVQALAGKKKVGKAEFLQKFPQ